VTRDVIAEFPHGREEFGRVLGHVVKAVEVGLDLAMLLLEQLGDASLIGFAKRRIDDMLLGIGMLVERMAELHQQERALGGLAVVGFEQFVEQAEDRLMLRGEAVGPISSRGAKALDGQFAAKIGGEREHRASDRGAGDDPGRSPVECALLAR